MHIGQIIRMLRIQRGLTQEQLALEAQVATSNVSRIENGLRQPSQELLQRLAEALKTPVSLIYTIQEEAVPSLYPETGVLRSESRLVNQDSFIEPTAFDIAFSDESQTLLKRFYQLTPKYRPLVLEHIQMLKRLQDQENEGHLTPDV